jgi:hypothetical protein
MFNVAIRDNKDSCRVIGICFWGAPPSDAHRAESGLGTD